jgi:hypothetical protein
LAFSAGDIARRLANHAVALDKCSGIPSLRGHYGEYLGVDVALSSLPLSAHPPPLPLPPLLPLLPSSQILANVFYEPSTRTSSSFAAAMQRLGGSVLQINEVSALSSPLPLLARPSSHPSPPHNPLLPPLPPFAVHVQRRQGRDVVGQHQGDAVLRRRGRPAAPAAGQRRDRVRCDPQARPQRRRRDRGAPHPGAARRAHDPRGARGQAGRPHGDHGRRPQERADGALPRPPAVAL